MSRNNFLKFGFGFIFIIISLIITASAYSAFVKPQSNECYFCHRTHYEGTTNPNHVASNFPTRCDNCHRAAAGKWRPASSFKHAGVTSGCYECHKAKYDSTTNPNHRTSGFPTICEQCHKSTNSWRPANFSHTKFPLVGVHATLQCSSCHQGGQYTGLSGECYSCHKAKYDSTTNPNHATAGYSTNCTQCHSASASSWKGATFSHTKFPLTGLHTTVECAKCHLNNQYTGTPRECYACHWTRNQKDPWKLRLGQTCEQCHNSSGWKPANWRHSSPPASWSLTGIHTTLSCAICHVNYQPVAGRDCNSCHRARYDATTNPNHRASGFPTTCEQCHNTSAWRPATFSHTRFPLTGLHTTVECAKCHLNNQYTGTPRECYACHWTRNQKDPWKLRLGQTCEQCHNTSTWKPANWSHSSSPAIWPLTGLHNTTACTTCHVNYQPVAGRDCYSCHRARYDATTNPNHRASGFPTTCEQCHRTSAWRPATFSHTRFPLTGLHTTVECAKCHLNNQYTGTPRECYACHWTRNQKDPWKLRLGQTCEQCHNTSTWKPANWSHSSSPAIWPLTGLHNTTACTTCHVNYQRVAGKECYSCHKAKYDATTNPKHASAGYPTTCGQCHNTTAWKPSTWKHTNFTLTGLHTTVECAKCHLNNQYTGTPRDCYSCHWTRNQRDPWKLRLGQTCEQCHNTSGWKPANWNHSSSPASWSLTGAHIRAVCATCHVNYQRVAGRDCNSCHKARYDASTNPKHSTARIGTQCQNCHNTSAWTPAQFNHATDGKGAISSKMANNKCNSCHPNNNDYTRNATKCLGCHKKEHKQDPCAQCHYTVAPWDKTR